MTVAHPQPVGRLEDFPVFSTDYPHWDNDTPAFALSKIPRAYRDRVASLNAIEVFGDRLRVPAAG